MKKFIRYISAAVLLIGIAACSEEINAPETPAIEEGVTLTIMSSAPQTRTMAGVQDLNENKIVSLHYFLYPENPSDPTADNTEVDPKFWGKITGLNAQNLQMIRLNLTEYELNYEVFPRPYTSCDVYVIANLPESIDVETLADRKLSTLKQLALEADFASSLTQENFVMEGMAQATVIDRKNIIAATGTIPVDRVASKVSVNVRVVESLTPTDDEIEVNGKTWTSQPENMTIEFVNGVSNAVLGADPAGLELSYFRTAKDQRAFTENTANGTWTCDPFYSYPSAWNIGDDNEPYLRISMPWYTIIDTPIGGVEPPVTVYRNCYYKVILGGDQLKRNTWYDLTIDIGVLGSFDEQEEVLLPLSDVTYYVADWFDGLQVESEILGGRYLVVERDIYEVFNQDKIEIPFSSSHKCVIVDPICQHPDLYNNGIMVNNTDYTLSVSSDNQTIIFENKLDNNMNSETFDFTPYTTTFTIQHDDNPTYMREVTIIQYPAIYAEAEENTDYSNGGDANGDRGFVWVNGYQRSNNGSYDFFGSAPGFSNTDADPNMYVFTVTTTEGTDYIIGDPRDTDYTYDASSAVWRPSPAIYDGATNRELKYYYGTEIASERYTNANRNTGVIYANDAAAEAAEPTINMIAPKFRLASGYAVLSTGDSEVQTLENLKKRCASYQEDGYPAGRWRLPTRAEFQFIMTQINLRNLPTVYIYGTAYWCAHGLGTPTDPDGQYGGRINMEYIGWDDAGHSVRCVYDEWYWENSDTYRLGTANADGTFTPSDTFTWGDMPRENFQ